MPWHPGRRLYARSLLRTCVKRCSVHKKPVCMGVVRSMLVGTMVLEKRWSLGPEYGGRVAKPVRSESFLSATVPSRSRVLGNNENGRRRVVPDYMQSADPL